MGILTDDMKRLVDGQQLAFHATVCPDGSPNLSPKGSTRVWDDDHLFFADICSPQTTANVRAGSLIEVNVVDPFVRKGYRFKGRAVIHEPGSIGFAEGIERMRAAGSKLAGRVQAIVVIEVRHAAPLVSPAYDDGAATEADILDAHRTRFARLHEHRVPQLAASAHRFPVRRHLRRQIPLAVPSTLARESRSRRCPRQPSPANPAPAAGWDVLPRHAPESFGALIA